MHIVRQSESVFSHLCLFVCFMRVCFLVFPYPSSFPSISLSISALYSDLSSISLFTFWLFSIPLSLPCSLDSLPTSVYLARYLFPFLPPLSLPPVSFPSLHLPSSETHPLLSSGNPSPASSPRLEANEKQPLFYPFSQLPIYPCRCLPLP